MPLLFPCWNANGRGVVTIELEIEAAIEKAKVGDESAIRLLYRSFNPQLLRYLKHHVYSDYEDVASETWIAIAKGLSDFHGNARDFRSWIFGICRNKVIDHYRTTTKARIAIDKERLRYNDRASPNNNDSTATPALANLSAEEAIETLLANLPPHHAEVLLLRVVADLSVDEVAKIVGKSPEAIRVIQHRAINTLVKRFNKEVVT